MRGNFILNSKITEEDFLSKTVIMKDDGKPTSILCANSTNLAAIIKNCRMIIMIDSVRNKPRKIVFDTKDGNYKSASPRNKELQRLSEIVFGNFCLSSKADGFKLHVIKDPAEVIMSKLFNVPFNLIFYDNKSFYRKVSPDSGNYQSFSSNSSLNSIYSSNQSPNSSSFIHQMSSNSNESVGSTKSCPKTTVRHRTLNSKKDSSSHSLGTEGIKNYSNFFNETFDTCHYRNVVMMSSVFIFSLPDENKAEFEEFIFQYYAMLESVLNRIANLIHTNCHNIFNGAVYNCWKESKQWLVSILPKNSSSLTASSITTSNDQTKLFNKIIDVQILEEVVNYFSKEKRLSFLAQIISSVIISNPNASFKYLKQKSRQITTSFPYSHILRNIGIDVNNNSFKRIIVKGLEDGKKMLSSGSWKDKLSTSLKYYKKMWNLQMDKSLSCSEIDISSRDIMEYLMKPIDERPVNECKQVQMITALVADLIRPFTKIVYQPHILPSDVPFVNEYRQVKLDNNRMAIEIPLLEEGLLLDREVLPENKELFYPSIIADHVVNFLNPLQGFVYNTPVSNLESHLLLESRQSEVIHNNNIYTPEFLIIDVDTFSVTIKQDPLLQSFWIQKLLEDFSVLIKIDGYDSVIGQLFLESAFEDLSQKILTINGSESNEQLTDKIDSFFLELNGFKESDLSLILQNLTFLRKQ